MDLQLKGKIVLITGSGRGIGKVVANRFAQEGAHIVLNDVNAESLETSRKELLSFPVEVLAVLGNLADEAATASVFRQIEAKFNALDVLVNNAAILIDKLLLEMSLDEWQRILRNNVDSVFLATREAVKLMRPERHPVIINAGSFGGLVPAIGYSAYNASKAAIMNLTATMAGELNSRGIRVTGYIPGVVRTEMTRAMLEREPKRMVAQIPIGRLAEPEEIANLVVFLASDVAGYINGSMVEVSGGKLCVQNPGRYSG